MSGVPLLAHQVRGSGERLLLLNGGMMSLAGWEPIARLLEERFTVVRCDLLGQLLSPGTPHASLDGHVADVVALLDHLGLGAVRLLGTSFGGEVGLLLAARHPARVRSLAAVAVTDFFDAEMMEAGMPILDACREALDGGDRGRVLDAIARFAYAPAWLEAHRAELAQRRAAVSLLPDAWFAGVAGLVDSLAGIDLRPVLPRIRCPVHVVAAGLDAAMPLRRTSAVAAAIPGARFTVVEGAGHALVVERPEAVVDLFLQEVPA